MSQTEPQGPYLVICPATVKRNWAREIEIVLPDADTWIIGPDDPPAEGFTGWAIINYDILGKHLDALCAFGWKCLVFDEAHYLKKHRSQRHKFSMQLIKQWPDEMVVHMLTGTPLASRPRDLFPLLQLAKHALGRSFMGFAKRYCDAYKGEYGWVTDGASNIEELTVHLHGIMLRRTKNEVLDLPPKIRTWLDVDVSSQVAHRMSSAVMELLQKYSRRGVRESLEEENSSTEERGRALGQLTRARLRLATSKVHTTLPFIEDVVDQGKKAIVFSRFLRLIEILKQKFGDQAVVITGEVPVAQRQERVDRFQEDDEVRLLLANITAGGVGLNFTAARQVIFNDLDWVPVNHWQAEDRAYRIGQTETVNVTYMVGRDTVDAFVRTVLETKADLIDEMVEGKALPEDFQRGVMGEMRRIMIVLQPKVDALDKDADTDVSDLLREASTAYREVHAEAFGTGEEVKKQMPSQEAIETLARVLSGPKVTQYLVESSSKPGSFYELELDGNDVSCSCRGFQFRGNCQHSRALKVALVKGEDLPKGYSEVVSS